MIGGLRRSRPKPARVADYASEANAGWTAVEAEVARSRRYGRTFVLIASPVGPEVARLLRPLLRAPDRTWFDGSLVYVLLTDCDLDEAAQFVRRVQSALGNVLSSDTLSIACFPGQAVTLGGLLAELRARPVPRSAWRAGTSEPVPQE